ncbi:unnamed protein product [Lupinus luteus]|uniref:Phytocyanin domain-containing protein n=1 Tax=Lupinus luteus TaxID=3873 RepID=A0AAV1WZZ7_LUPLU
MAHRRGNNAIIVVMLLFCMLVFHFEITHATTYDVGGAAGWNINVSNWTSGKTFKSGDILG